MNSRPLPYQGSALPLSYRSRRVGGPLPHCAGKCKASVNAFVVRHVEGGAPFQGRISAAIVASDNARQDSENVARFSDRSLRQNKRLSRRSVGERASLLSLIADVGKSDDRMNDKADDRMNDKAKDRPDRAARLAGELRANLAKRKAQARSRRPEQVSEKSPTVFQREPAKRQDAEQAERRRSRASPLAGEYQTPADGLGGSAGEGESAAGDARRSNPGNAGDLSWKADSGPPSRNSRRNNKPGG